MDARPAPRTPRSAALAAATLAVATLAACSGTSTQPVTTPAARTTSTTSAAATPQAPTTPVTTPSTPPTPAPLQLAFTSVRRTVTADGVRATVPRVRVTGGDPAARATARAAVEREIDRLVAEFAAAARDNADLPAAQRFLVVEATAGRWGGYATVRLEETAQTGGAYPANTVHGLLLGSLSGEPAPVARMFTDPRAVDALVRRRIVAANPRVFADGVVTPADLRGVSIVAGPDGRTTPLTCLPVVKGLDCTVDQDSVAPHVVGPLRAVVPWSRLDDLLMTPLSPGR